MFLAYVLIVRRSKLYYTVSGINTYRWPSRAQIERWRKATYRCDDTRDCI